MFELVSRLGQATACGQMSEQFCRIDERQCASKNTTKRREVFEEKVAGELKRKQRNWPSTWRRTIISRSRWKREAEKRTDEKGNGE